MSETQSKNNIEKLLSNFSPDVIRMITALADHDYNSAMHSLRVSQISMKIARMMGFDKNFANEMGESAVLHDIGKIAIKSEFLNKSEPLTAEEFQIIKTHVLFDAEKYFGIKIPESAKQTIYQHHERENGSGYPRGLKNDEIAIFAKICAVADSFDAMTNFRTYQKTLDVITACREIESKSGILYDRKVVDAFLSLPEFQRTL